MGHNSAFQKKCRELLSIGAALAVYCILSFFVHIPCPIKWFTGVSCPGCGMTRSLLALCRLDVSKAVYYHPLVFYIAVVVPLLVVLHLRDAVKLRKVVIAVSAFLMISVYLYRMIVLHTPVLEFDPANGALPRLFRWAGNLLG